MTTAACDCGPALLVGLCAGLMPSVWLILKRVSERVTRREKGGG